MFSRKILCKHFPKPAHITPAILAWLDLANRKTLEVRSLHGLNNALCLTDGEFLQPPDLRTGFTKMPNQWPNSCLRTPPTCDRPQSTLGLVVGPAAKPLQRLQAAAAFPAATTALRHSPRSHSRATAAPQPRHSAAGNRCCNHCPPQCWTWAADKSRTNRRTCHRAENNARN